MLLHSSNDHKWSMTTNYRRFLNSLIYLVDTAGNAFIAYNNLSSVPPVDEQKHAQINKNKTRIATDIQAANRICTNQVLV